MPNPSGVNGFQDSAVTPQMSQSSFVQPVAQGSLRVGPLVQQRLAQAMRPAPLPPSQAHIERARALRELAASAPPGLEHLAADLHRRAGLMEAGGRFVI